MQIFRIFRKLFVNFVLSNDFPEIGDDETIRLVRKSSKSELSSQFFRPFETFLLCDPMNSSGPFSGSFWLVLFFSVLLVFSAFGFLAFVSGFSVGSFRFVWLFGFFRLLGSLRSFGVFLCLFSVLLVLSVRFGPLRPRRFFLVLLMYQI